MKSIEFEVYGIPQPKGSTRAFARMVGGQPVATVTTSNPNLAQWAALVRGVAQKRASELFFGQGEPVAVVLRFKLSRPKSLPKRVLWPTTKPDIDKLERAVLDALTGTVFHDDAQVISTRTSKRYAAADEPPGVSVLVGAA